MTDAQVLTIVSDAMMVATKVAAPIILTALFLGVLVSLFQAVTQVQEMTLTFVPKLMGVAVVILVGGSWMMREMVSWVIGLWQSMGGMV
jgi:flagellar biosynthetic protein FliQ